MVEAIGILPVTAARLIGDEPADPGGGRVAEGQPEMPVQSCDRAERLGHEGSVSNMEDSIRSWRAPGFTCLDQLGGSGCPVAADLLANTEPVGVAGERSAQHLGQP